MGKTLTKRQKDLLDGYGFIPGMDPNQIRKQMLIYKGCIAKDGMNQVEIQKNKVYVNCEPFSSLELRDALLRE